MAGHRTVTTARSEVAYSCRMYVQYWAHQLKTGTARSYRASRNRISTRELPLWVVLVSTMGERGPGRGRAFDLQCSTRSRSPTPHARHIPPPTPHRAAWRRGNPQAIHWPSTGYRQAFPHRVAPPSWNAPCAGPLSGRAVLTLAGMGERAARTRPRSCSPYAARPRFHSAVCLRISAR